MAKNWKRKKDKKLNFKKEKMERIQNEEIKKRILEKHDPIENEEVEPETFSVREYKNRFLRITAYQLGEDSKIRCADGRELQAKAGEYYVCLDQVQELVLPAEVFKKMFIVKLEN